MASWMCHDGCRIFVHDPLLPEYIGHDIPFVIIFVITFCSSDCGPESESRWTIHHCWLHSRLLHQPQHWQPQHRANTGKLSNLLRNIQNIINTRLMPVRVGTNNESVISHLISPSTLRTELHSLKTYINIQICLPFNFPLILVLEKRPDKIMNVKILPWQRVWAELGMS